MLGNYCGKLYRIKFVGELMNAECRLVLFVLGEHKYFGSFCSFSLGAVQKLISVMNSHFCSLDVFFGIWYVIISSPMVIFISYRKSLTSAKTSSLGAACFFGEDPSKICLGAKTLQSCLGRVSHTPTHYPWNICS